jgi:hypothetical protein
MTQAPTDSKITYTGHSTVFKILSALKLLNFLTSSLKWLRALIMVKIDILENTHNYVLDINIWSAF